jgi:hypothetical protein
MAIEHEIIEVIYADGRREKRKIPRTDKFRNKNVGEDYGTI